MKQNETSEFYNEYVPAVKNRSQRKTYCLFIK